MSWRQEILAIHERVVKAWKPYSIEDRRYLALALAGEVGELCNLIKKDWRGDSGDRNQDIADELADAQIYLELLAKAYGVNLDQACMNKLVEVRRRYPVATCVESSDIDRQALRGNRIKFEGVR